MVLARRPYLLPIISPVALLLGTLLMLGCDKPVEPASSPPVSKPASNATLPDPKLQLASLEAWKLGEQTLNQTLTYSRALHSQLEAFLLAPEPDALTELRQHWRQAHGHWHQLDPFLALTGSNPGLFGGLERLVADIEARPIQPGYLDYIEHYPYTGIVNDITLTINAETLRAQHGLTDASDISLGFHALEFLLWGETGERPVSDFQVAEQASAEQRQAGLTLAELPNNRRRDLLVLISHLLQDDLNNLLTRWQGPDSQLHQTYHRLHPASRIELLKNATEHYLRQEAPRLFASLGSDEEHNAFAGHSLVPLVEGLKGLQQLFRGVGIDSLSGASETTTIQQSLEELDQLIAQLAQLDAQQTLDPEVKKELQQQLERLAQLLRPTELNSELLSRD